MASKQMPEDWGLEGKVAIVTGGGAAGTGIGNGRAAAILLAWSRTKGARRSLWAPTSRATRTARAWSATLWIATDASTFSTTTSASAAAAPWWTSRWRTGGE